MAIFTHKADLNLPILTQLYQANGFKEVQLVGNRFLLSRMARQIAQRSELLNARPSVIAAVIKDQLESDPTPESASEIQYLVRTLLDALADGGCVTGRDLNRLAALGSAVRMVPQLEWQEDSPTLEELLKGVLVAEDSTYDPKQIKMQKRGQPFSEWVFSEIQRVMHGDDALSRCNECNSVFVVQKTGQQYCSHKCADRVSTRRRRNKSDKKTVETVRHAVY